jgi:actin related protein 2/3 complex subunit 2
MILLEPHNIIIQTTLSDKLVKPSSLDVQFVDFDGVRFHLSTPEKQKTVLLLSMNIRCWDELVQYGAMEVLQREYGPLLVGQAEPDYNVSLQIDLEQVPAEPEAREAFVKSIALFKRNAVAAPFELGFKTQKELADTNKMGELMQIHYRDEEAIYVQASHDRVTVIFSTIFQDETDRIFGRLFLQEFVDARRQPSIQNAPQVLYSSRDPPLEIRHLPNLRNTEDIGYVTFVLFPRHFANPNVASTTISHIQLFRDYLHYHIKCSKAYMHSRMRHRVSEFQKVLNRAKMEVATAERKTVSGRTMVTR